MAHDVERVFADIDADHGDRGTGCLGHGVLLVLAPLASLSLAGQEHGRTIPLAEINVVQLRCRTCNPHGFVSCPIWFTPTENSA
ncbi:hypothetical protein EI171_20310 [Bradyrhizobium sp. LCT2]|nr:hypothetical protein EI171_20310 [Bradyrhizobium sp. LCT2]